MTDPSRWVTAASCARLSEAEATAAVLESEGIETRIEDHARAGTSQSAPWAAASPKVVLVREPDVERAREVLGAVSTANEAELEAEAMAAREPPEDEPAEEGSGGARIVLIALAALVTIALALWVLAPQIEP